MNIFVRELFPLLIALVLVLVLVLVCLCRRGWLIMLFVPAVGYFLYVSIFVFINFCGIRAVDSYFGFHMKAAVDRR